MNNYPHRSKGLSPLEVVALITMVFVSVGVVLPFATLNWSQAATMKDVANQKSVIIALRMYAIDWEGEFPSEDADGNPFQTSTEVFQFLIDDVDLGTETIFYVAGNPEKPYAPNEDGILEPEENGMCYVSGQYDTMPSISPLVSDEMVGPGLFGENHPFYRSRGAVVGYVGGHVRLEKLTEAPEDLVTASAPFLETNPQKPYLIAQGPAGSGVSNIFGRAEVDEEGAITGGYLAVSPDNILYPEKLLSASPSKPHPPKDLGK